MSVKIYAKVVLLIFRNMRCIIGKSENRSEHTPIH